MKFNPYLVYMSYHNFKERPCAKVAVKISDETVRVPTYIRVSTMRFCCGVGLTCSTYCICYLFHNTAILCSYAHCTVINLGVF